MISDFGWIFFCAMALLFLQKISDTLTMIYDEMKRQRRMFD